MNNICCFCFVLLLIACETLPPTPDKTISEEDTLAKKAISTPKIKDTIKRMDWEMYPTGLWIGKS